MLEALHIVAMLVFVLLAAVIIPTLWKLKHVLGEVHEALEAFRAEGFPLLREARGLIANINRLTDAAQARVEQFTVFGNAVEDVGRQLKQVQTLVEHSSRTWSIGVKSGWAGLRAAAAVLTGRTNNQQGGEQNGHE